LWVLRQEGSTLGDQVSFELCDNVLPDASSAVADSETKGTDPVSLRFDGVKLLVVVISEAKTAELPLADKFGAFLREMSKIDP